MVALNGISQILTGTLQINGGMTQVASGLMRASDTSPELRPLAVMTNVIYNLPSPENVRTKSLTNLVRSPEAQTVLKKLNLSQVGALKTFLGDKEATELLGADEALFELVRGIPVWRADFVRSGLGQVVNAWGLPDVLLAIEHVYGGITDADYQRAKGELRDLEEMFDNFIRDARSKPIEEQIKILSTPEQRQSRKVTQRIRSFKKKSKIQRALLIIGIRTFLEPWLEVFPDDKSPMRLTDFLIGRGSDIEDLEMGFCVPVHALGGHLGLRMGIQLQTFAFFVVDSGHINLFDGTLGFVFDLSSTSVFSALSDLKKSGFIGPQQKPEPLTNIIAFAFGNLKNETVRDVSGQLAPNSFTIRFQQAITEDNPEKALKMAEGLIKINPKEPHLHSWMGRSLFFRDRYGEAIEVLRKSLALFRHKKQENIRSINFARIILIHALIHNGDRSDAVAELANLDLDQDSDHSLLERVGSAYLKLGNFEEAFTHWERALAQDPSHAKSIKRKIKTCKENGSEKALALAQMIEERFGEQISPETDDGSH